MSGLELLDVVDINDNIIGQLPRNEVYRQALGFRVINAFLVNNTNQVWIPRRAPNKKLFPSCLDASVGGHVESGESYECAFIRELAEELNIDASMVNYEFAFKLNPRDHGVSAHMQVYIIRTSDTPPYNVNDFSESSWFEIENLSNLLKNGEPSKGDLLKLVENLKEFLEENISVKTI